MFGFSESSINVTVYLIFISGFGCGWDVIFPAGWAMPFWLAFIFRGARPAGLREASSHELESGKCEFLPPDSTAGAEEGCRKGKELRETFFRYSKINEVN